MNTSDIPRWMTSGGDRIRGFEVKGGTEPVTKGINFWSKPYILRRSNGSRMCLLLMDTQGLWDKDTSNDFNCILFGLSCVLSSYAIFNQKNNINTEELERLASRSLLSKEMVSDGRKKSFQRLDILLRDYEEFSLDDDDVSVGEIVRKERLDQLKTEVAEKEAFEQVESCFSKVDVSCSFDPGNKVRGRNYSGLIGEIEPKFLQLLSQTIERVVREVEPLNVSGRRLKGEEFVECVC